MTQHLIKFYLPVLQNRHHCTVCLFRCGFLAPIAAQIPLETHASAMNGSARLPILVQNAPKFCFWPGLCPVPHYLIGDWEDVLSPLHAFSIWTVVGSGQKPVSCGSSKCPALRPRGWTSSRCRKSWIVDCSSGRHARPASAPSAANSTHSASVVYTMYIVVLVLY